MIDPLLNPRKRDESPAVDWYDDPWDNPRSAARSTSFDDDAVPKEFGWLSRPLKIAALATASVTLFMGGYRIVVRASCQSIGHGSGVSIYGCRR